MLSRFSRRERISETKSQKRLFLAIGISAAIFIALLFYGVPALINMSIFISNLNRKNQPAMQTATNSGVVFPPSLQAIPQATNSATMTISGFSDKGNNVSLYLNGDQFGSTLAANDGTFTFPDVTLKDGQNTIYAKAANSSGKESENSNQLSILFKKTSPKLELAGPDDNLTVTGDNKFVVVSGLTDPQNSVTVNDHIVVVNPDGSFSYQQILNDGDNTINIVSTDSAGNQTKTTRRVKYSSS